MYNPCKFFPNICNKILNFKIHKKCNNTQIWKILLQHSNLKHWKLVGILKFYSLTSLTVCPSVRLSICLTLCLFNCHYVVFLFPVFFLFLFATRATALYLYAIVVASSLRWLLLLYVSIVNMDFVSYFFSFIYNLLLLLLVLLF